MLVTIRRAVAAGYRRSPSLAYHARTRSIAASGARVAAIPRTCSKWRVSVHFNYRPRPDPRSDRGSPDWRYKFAPQHRSLFRSSRRSGGRVGNADWIAGRSTELGVVIGPFLTLGNARAGTAKGKG